jgi:DNA-binding NtrC family response regulator
MSTVREPRWAAEISTPPRAADAKPVAPTRVQPVEPMPTTSRTPIRLLVVDDDEQMRRTLVGRFERKGIVVSSAGSGEQALEIAAKTRFDVAVLDLHLPGINGVELLEKLKERQPDLEALLLTAHSSVETAVAAMKKGAYDYLLKPFHLPELEVHIQKAYEKVQLSRREQRLVQHLHRQEPKHKLVGSSPAICKIASLIEKVAPTDATILVRGPSGTGKEVVARAIHAGSPRRDNPMVTINCAALQESLLESELFGHEKGAFTGAVSAKPGLVEVAEGGTLFIDEIGEMAVGLQAKLLRVLEDGHFRRVGGTTEQRADVRVVAATNRSLEDEIKSNRFREDLYYRLNVITMRLPPLRERRSDIPELVEYFLATRQVGPARCRVDQEALDALMRYDWPGNVRELANVLERAQILAQDAVITVDDLPDAVFTAGPPAAAEDESGHNLHDAQRRHVLTVLREEKGNKAHAARALGISRRALYRLLEKYDLNPPHPGAGEQTPRGAPNADADPGD